MNQYYSNMFDYISILGFSLMGMIKLILFLSAFKYCTPLLVFSMTKLSMHKGQNKHFNEHMLYPKIFGHNCGFSLKSNVFYQKSKYEKKLEKKRNNLHEK